MGYPEHRRLEPGLHVHTSADPVALAHQLATELDGELCGSAVQADGLLEELAALPALDAAGIERLVDLTDRVATARRIADRTLDRATAQVGERLADGGAGLAIHPRSVRDRADAVVGARQAVAAADAQLQARERAAVEAEPEPEPPAPPPIVPSEDGPPARRRRGFFGFGRRRDDDAYEQDTSESTSILQQMAAATDDAFGARRASAARDDDLVLLRVQRDRAEEDLRVVERAWRDLVGDADVDDVEAVVRRFDPQHQAALTVAQETVGARVASTLVQRAVDRWAEGWRSLGLEPPATPDQGAMGQMAQRLGRAVVLVGEAVDRAEVMALAAPAAAVVAVEPVAS